MQQHDIDTLAAYGRQHLRDTAYPSAADMLGAVAAMILSRETGPSPATADPSAYTAERAREFGWLRDLYARIVDPPKVGSTIIGERYVLVSAEKWADMRADAAIANVYREAAQQITTIIGNGELDRQDGDADPVVSQVRRRVKNLTAEINRLRAVVHGRESASDEVIAALEAAGYISQRGADEEAPARHLRMAAELIRDRDTSIKAACKVRDDAWRALGKVAELCGVASLGQDAGQVATLVCTEIDALRSAAVAKARAERDAAERELDAAREQRDLFLVALQNLGFTSGDLDAWTAATRQALADAETMRARWDELADARATLEAGAESYARFMEQLRHELGLPVDDAPTAILGRAKSLLAVRDEVERHLEPYCQNQPVGAMPAAVARALKAADERIAALEHKVADTREQGEESLAAVLVQRDEILIALRAWRTWAAERIGCGYTHRPADTAELRKISAAEDASLRERLAYGRREDREDLARAVQRRDEYAARLTEIGELFERFGATGEAKGPDGIALAAARAALAHIDRQAARIGELENALHLERAQRIAAEALEKRAKDDADGAHAVADVVRDEATRRCLVFDGNLSKVAADMFDHDRMIGDLYTEAARASGRTGTSLVEWCRESAAIRRGVRRGEIELAPLVQNVTIAQK